MLSWPSQESKTQELNLEFLSCREGGVISEALCENKAAAASWKGRGGTAGYCKALQLAQLLKAAQRQGTMGPFLLSRAALPAAWRFVGQQGTLQPGLCCLADCRATC